MKAVLRNYRQSPRKVRLLVDLIRGKKVSRALPVLSIISKRAAGPIKKLLESAIANAKNNDNISEDALFVKEIRVDEGPTLKRIRARARGSAFAIRKRTSHILITLGEEGISSKKVKSSDDLPLAGQAAGEVGIPSRGKKKVSAKGEVASDGNKNKK